MQDRIDTAWLEPIRAEIEHATMRTCRHQVDLTDRCGASSLNTFDLKLRIRKRGSPPLRESHVSHTTTLPFVRNELDFSIRSKQLGGFREASFVEAPVVVLNQRVAHEVHECVRTTATTRLPATRRSSLACQ